MWKVPSLRFVGFLSHTSSTWSRLWPCRSSEEPRTTRGSSHSLSRLISIRLAGWAFQVMLTASAVSLMIDFRNVGSPLELAPGSGCRFAPRLRRRLWLRPARSVFIALQHATANHRELQQHLLGGLVVDSSVRQLSLLCKIAHSSVFSFHSSSCCLPCCIQQPTRVPDRDSPSVVVQFRLIDASVPGTCLFRRLKRLHRPFRAPTTPPYGHGEAISVLARW